MSREDQWHLRMGDHHHQSSPNGQGNVSQTRAQLGKGKPEAPEVSLPGKDEAGSWHSES